MLTGLWQAILFQQQFAKVRRSLQFKQGGGLPFRPVDCRQQAFLRFELILDRSRRQDEPFHPEQGGHMQKFASALLLLDCIHD
jgi:hypothetical protein